jgi:hypothetical protein
MNWKSNLVLPTRALHAPGAAAADAPLQPADLFELADFLERDCLAANYG